MEISATLASALTAFFGDNKIVACEPYGSGHIHQTFKVTVLQEEAEEVFILQRFNQVVFQQPNAVMTNLGFINQHLRQQPSYPLIVLEPVPDREGNLLYQDAAGEYWRVFPFIPNTFTLDRPERPEQARAAARAFGAFLRALQKFDATQLDVTIPDFHDSLQRMRHFWAIVKRADPQRIFAAKAEIELLTQHIKFFHHINALKLPQRVVHNDTKINNVLFDAATQEAVCVIDLDTVMPGTILSDFGDMVRTFTPTISEEERGAGDINIPIFEALTAGFLEAIHKGLSPVEREHLVDGAQWMTLEQALRFLTDYLAGDVYYKTTYSEQNLFRARNQFQFFKVLHRRENELKKIVSNMTK